MKPLRHALDATREEFASARAGRVSIYVDESGSGIPLLLVHSINAAPSAYEMKPLFEHYRGKRPVFALDMPGFGHSERGDRDYTAALYTDVLNELLGKRIGAPADVVALSLSSEFAAAAALAQPEQVRSLVLLSPTGLGHRAPPGETAQRNTGRFLRTPLLSEALFQLITSKRSIRYFLGLNFHGEPPAEMVDYAYATSHQPEARFAPFTFLSFSLFTRDAHAELYGRVEAPALVVYDEDPNISFERLPELLQEKPNWRAERVQPTLGLPHWEKLDETVDAMERFWSEAETP